MTKKFEAGGGADSGSSPNGYRDRVGTFSGLNTDVGPNLHLWWFKAHEQSH